MSLAQEANRYLDEKVALEDNQRGRQAAATSLYTAICVISRLKTMLYPFLPFSSQKVHEYLGFEGRLKNIGWKSQVLTFTRAKTTGAQAPLYQAG